MKTSILLATVLGLATAQNFAGQPACASPCLSSAIPVAGCALDDQGCQCGTGKAGIQAAVATCLVAGCSLDDLLLAQRVGDELCVAYSSTAMVLTIQTSTVPLTSSGSGLNTTATATASLASTTVTNTLGGVSTSVPYTNATSPATTSPPSSRILASGSPTARTTSSSTAGAAQGAGKGAGVGGILGLVLGLVAAL